MKKCRSERKGRRSFDTAIEYGTVAMVAREKTRTAKAAVHATYFLAPVAAAINGKNRRPLKKDCAIRPLRAFFS